MTTYTVMVEFLSKGSSKVSLSLGRYHVTAHYYYLSAIDKEWENII